MKAVLLLAAVAGAVRARPVPTAAGRKILCRAVDARPEHAGSLSASGRAQRDPPWSRAASDTRQGVPAAAGLGETTQSAQTELVWQRTRSRTSADCPAGC